jgi:hypothetical protein
MRMLGQSLKQMPMQHLTRLLNSRPEHRWVRRHYLMLGQNLQLPPSRMLRLAQSLTQMQPQSSVLRGQALLHLFDVGLESGLQEYQDGRFSEPNPVNLDNLVV